MRQGLAQHAGQFVGGLQAIFHVLGQQAIDDCHEPFRDVGVDFADGARGGLRFDRRGGLYFPTEGFLFESDLINWLERNGYEYEAPAGEHAEG